MATRPWTTGKPGKPTTGKWVGEKSSDAEREASAFHKKTGRIIKLISVQEILNEEHVKNHERH